MNFETQFQFITRRGIILWVSGLALVASPFVQRSYAADNTWTNGAANLTWNTASTNWMAPTVWNNANVDSAIFGPTGVGTITLQNPITARALQFNTAGYALTGSGANVLTLASGGGGSLGIGEIQTNASATIAAVIAGTVGLTKTGSGTLTLTGVNTYTGGTTISSTLAAGGRRGASTGTSPTTASSRSTGRTHSSSTRSCPGRAAW